MVGQALKGRQKVENSRERATQPGTPLAPARERGFILKCGGTAVAIAFVVGRRQRVARARRGWNYWVFGWDFVGSSSVRLA